MSTGDRQHHESPYPLAQSIQLREYIEALFREKERALDMAAQERDRAAEVLRDEQRRALLVAEAEREKAASALRQGTDRAIADNFARLAERLEAMKEQIAETERHRVALEVERKRAVEDAFNSAEKAVEKAEMAQQRVNITQNEFRGTLADQASTLMPRKEVESLIHERDRRLSEISDAISEIRTNIAVGPPDVSILKAQQSQREGQEQGRAHIGVTADRIVPWVISAGAVIAAAVIAFAK